MYILAAGEGFKELRDHHSYERNLGSCENNAWKKFRLSNTGAVLYELSYQANGEQWSI